MSLFGLWLEFILTNVLIYTFLILVLPYCIKIIVEFKLSEEYLTVDVQAFPTTDYGLKASYFASQHLLIKFMQHIILYNLWSQEEVIVVGCVGGRVN